MSDGTMIGTLSVNVQPYKGFEYYLDIVTQNHGIETAGADFKVDTTIVDVYGNPTGNPNGTSTQSVAISCSFDDATSIGAFSPKSPPQTNITFTDGKASFGTFTLYNANEEPCIVIHDEFNFLTGTSSPITVNASATAKLKFSAPGMVTAGSEFLLGTITLYDNYGNTATTSGPKSVKYHGPQSSIQGGIDPRYTKDVSFEHGISITPLATTLVYAT
ncbi:MAG: hypothetical protein AAB267_02260, partial [Candidatus Desantisbacteria bacterium]